MPRFAFHLVTTGRQELHEVKRILAQCSSASIDALHIREKHRTAREILQWYHACSELLPLTSIYINDRLDVAAAVEATGVQLAHHSLPPSLARKIFKHNTIIGCSVHNLAEAEAAVREGADYVMFGHIYKTASKQELPGQGPVVLQEIVEKTPIPVIAIGGINPGNVNEVLSTGVSGIAVMSVFFDHSDPSGQARKIRMLLDNSPFVPKFVY